MLRHFVKSSLILLIVAGLTSCATLLSRGKDTIKIESDPSGAEIFIGQEKLGVTPASIEVDRDTFRAKYLILKKSGYKTKQVFLEKTITGTAFFNLGFITTTFGATSWGIDALTGNMFEYSPGFYSIDLEPNHITAEVSESDDAKASLERLKLVTASFETLLRDISAGGGEWLDAYSSLRTNNNSAATQNLKNEICKNRVTILQAKTPAQLFRRLEEVHMSGAVFALGSF